MYYRLFTPIALALLVSSAMAQAPGTPPYPPPGRLVDVGGYRVHLYCTGNGSPTVMVVGAGFSFDWGLVQPEVAKSTRICTYDASGTAWSDPGPPLSCTERVNQVHKLLRNAGIDGPYVLVGLSVGALVSRLYAGMYADEVAGIVMVDHAFIDVGSDAAPGHSGAPTASGLDSPPVLIQQTPVVVTAEDSSKFSNLPERNQKLHRWAASLKPVLPTVETAEGCLSQLQARGSNPRPLGSTPLAVVSTGNRLPNYKRLQAELLSLSSRSEQFMALGSIHSVEIDEPGIVVAAIGQVVDRVRQEGNSPKRERR